MVDRTTARQPLFPLVRPMHAAGGPVSFPLRLAFDRVVIGVVPARRRVLTRLVWPLRGRPELRPAPITPASGGLVVTQFDWTDTPAGPFRHVLVLVPAFLGRGSPVPGAAFAAHVWGGRAEVLGRYGYVPLLSFADTRRGAALCADLWGAIPFHSSIRASETRGRAIVQVDREGDTLLRMDLPVPRRRTDAIVVPCPLFGVRDEATWHDHLTIRGQSFGWQLRPGPGHLGLLADGPIARAARALRRRRDGYGRARILARGFGGAGTITIAGPRPSTSIVGGFQGFHP